MKIVNINKVKDHINIFEVELQPNWIEKLFGSKNKIIKVKATDEMYLIGGGRVYLYPNGEELGNGNYIGKAIDQHLKKW